MKNTILTKLKKINYLVKNQLSNSLFTNRIDPLTKTQGYIIAYIFHETERQKHIFQKDIEANFQMAKATVSEIILTLENNGYIKRIPWDNDARYKQIILTDLGYQKQALVEQEMDRVEQKMLEDFTVDEINQLDLFLTRLIEKI